jgi:hypothetical protein
MATALVAGLAATADAQVCTGNAPFSAGRMRVGVGAEFPEGAKAYGAGLTVGHGSGMYFGGAITRLDDSNGPASAMDFTANIGYQMTFDAAPSLRFCPNGHFGITNGPDAGAVENSATHLGLGAAVGGVLSSSENLSIVPSLGMNWVHASYETSAGGGSTSVSDSWLEASLGAGFILNRDVTFAPMLRIPLNRDGAESTFGFTLSYNFGRSGGVVQQGGRRRR